MNGFLPPGLASRCGPPREAAAVATAIGLRDNDADFRWESELSILERSALQLPAAGETAKPGRHMIGSGIRAPLDEIRRVEADPGHQGPAESHET